MINTKIEWAHHTINFWWGCSKVSEACRYCCAELLAKLFSRGKATWGATGARWIRIERALEELRKLDVPLRSGERVFINSMSDTFEDRRDLDAARAAMFAEFEKVKYLKLLLLTKRPHLVMQIVPAAWRENWPAHVWVGTTVENQVCADDRIPSLLRIPSQIRFLSCEPLLGPVDIWNVCDRWQAAGNELPNWMRDNPFLIHWVIAGGESGCHARAMHPDWVRSIRDQCANAGVPFFFKQWGEWQPAEPMADEFPTCGEIPVGKYALNDWDDYRYSQRVGKKRAGRELDGIQLSEVPA